MVHLENWSGASDELDCLSLRLIRTNAMNLLGIGLFLDFDPILQWV